MHQDRTKLAQEKAQEKAQETCRCRDPLIDTLRHLITTLYQKPYYVHKEHSFHIFLRVLSPKAVDLIRISHLGQ